MNERDIEMLEREVRQLQLNPAVAFALMRIQHDMSVILDKVTRIEESIMTPPNGWPDHDEEQEDLRDPPF